jgi:hypothetical protein
MGKLSHAVVLGIAALLACTHWSNRVAAADIAYKTPRYASRDCHEVRRCGPAGCDVKLVCYRRGCYDGYSCYPLYGAYGPYGGVRYWGAYSWNVWDP